MKSGYSVAGFAFRELRGVVSCRNQGKHAINREEFADDFHTSSLSTNYLVVFPTIYLVVFPTMQVERFCSRE